MTTHVITWYNQLTREREYEEFEWLLEAQAALESFRESYPWNTYTLSQVIDVVVASETWPGPYPGAETITVEVAPLTKTSLRLPERYR